MNCTATLTCLTLALCSGHGLAQGTGKQAKPQSWKELVSLLKAREVSVKSVEIEMETEGPLPDGMRFRTEGSMRVLAGTHFHSSMRVRFGEDLEAETETVKTPLGVWTREKDPVQGTVITHMKPELVAKLESASRFLDKEAGLPGMGAGTKGPLGSAMIEDLGRQFDLDLSGPEAIDKQKCWVISGKLRKGQVVGDSIPPELAPDRVEIAVRTRDLVVVRMIQFRDSKPLTTVRITSIVLDAPMDKNTFTLKLPPRATAIDVMEHPPAREQIEAVLQDARDKRWKWPNEAGKDNGKGGGKDDKTPR